MVLDFLSVVAPSPLYWSDLHDLICRKILDCSNWNGHRGREGGPTCTACPNTHLVKCVSVPAVLIRKSYRITMKLSMTFVSGCEGVQIISCSQKTFVSGSSGCSFAFLKQKRLFFFKGHMATIHFHCVRREKCAVKLNFCYYYYGCPTR